jgi:hypothetical protein
MNKAMFVRKRGLWLFHGITYSDLEVSKFVSVVEADIKSYRSAPAIIRTDNYRIVELPDRAMWEEDNDG